MIIIIESKPARVVATAHALHAQHLPVRLAADCERNEVVPARHGRRLPAAAETTTATLAALSRRL
jgi:hypothetical protein